MQLTNVDVTVCELIALIFKLDLDTLELGPVIERIIGNEYIDKKRRYFLIKIIMIMFLLKIRDGMKFLIKKNINMMILIVNLIFV